MCGRGAVRAGDPSERQVYIAPPPTQTLDPPWLQKARTQAQSKVAGPQLLLEEPLQGPPVPVQESGVSLAWLQRLVKFAGRVMRPGLDTEQLVTKLLVLLCRHPQHGRLRLYDLVPPEHRGPPQYYLVHTWSDTFERVVQQACKYTWAQASKQAAAQPQADGDLSPRDTEVRRPDPASGASSPRRHAKLELHKAQQAMWNSTYVWLDVVAVSQHSNMAAKVTGPDLEMIAAALTAAKAGVLVMLDPDFEVLNRCWCMYESWLVVYLGDCERVSICFPEDMDLQDLVSFQSKCFNLDLTRCHSSKAEDKQKIIAEVKHKVGMRRMHQLLPDSLMRSSRAGLRWSGDLASISMYCAILIENREWYQLQAVLHSIPEVHDDEKMLQDIRAVFGLYDTDGSGELDHDEFVEVLAVAGFTHEEAHNIFSLVDKDGGGSVSLEEFESWWIESQRQQSTRHNAKCEFTAPALATNLTAMISLLQRSGLESRVPFYETALRQVQGMVRAQERSSRPPQPLNPTRVKGDWKAVAEQTAWRISNSQYKAAAKLMFGLLLWNADLLTASPADIGMPGSAQTDIEQLRLLCKYMELFADLLATSPGNIRQAHYFLKAAAEVRTGVLEDLEDAELEKQGLPTPRRRSKRKHGAFANLKSSQSMVVDDHAPQAKSPTKPKHSAKKAKQKESVPNTRQKKGPKLFPTRADMQREVIVGDMVKLKYGSTTLITAQQIVEAEKSLSAWMAAQKKNQGRGLRQDEREAVASFTSEYLSAGPMAAPTSGDTPEPIVQTMSMTATATVHVRPGGIGGWLAGGGMTTEKGRPKANSAPATSLPPLQVKLPAGDIQSDGRVLCQSPTLTRVKLPSIKARDNSLKGK